MKRTITPFICLNDFEYMDNFSKGWHHSSPELLHVEGVRIGYPITDWGQGGAKTFAVDPKYYTVGELMRTVNALVIDEINKGNNYAPHDAEDYCIECIEVMDNIANISFGS